MGFMNAWEIWSAKQYALWGKDLQKKYDYFRELRFSESTLATLDTLCELLPEIFIRKLMQYIIEMNGKVGPKEAEKWLKEFLEKLKAFSF